jgi:hypothetical protein
VCAFSSIYRAVAGNALHGAGVHIDDHYGRRQHALVVDEIGLPILPVKNRVRCCVCAKVPGTAAHRGKLPTNVFNDLRKSA